MRHFILFYLIGSAIAGMAADDWLTKAERTAFAETARYAEVVEFCKKLDRASEWVKYEAYGKSGELRDQPLLIVAKHGEFTPEKAAKSKKAVVLVINCIHPGEVDGKDASLMLARDLVIRKQDPAILENIILVIIPIFGTDGHERFGPYNRINQNGPKEMGWRVTSRNLNLNRDFIKADSVEMRSFLKLWNAWRPDLFFDNHTTDGADWQYDVAYGLPLWDTMHPAVVEWQRRNLVEAAFRDVELDGHLVSPYMGLMDIRDPSKGVGFGDSSPRFSTGYGHAQNRPSILVETHMLKDYRTRVMATYAMMRRTLLQTAKDPGSLKRAVRLADSETTKLGEEYDVTHKVTLSVESTRESVPFLFKGWEFEVVKSAISGSEYIRWDTTKPKNTPSKMFDQAKPSLQISPPLAYIIPPQWTEPAELCRLHGLRVDVLQQDAAIAVESYRFSEARWADAPFEGRVMLNSFRLESRSETRRFPKGSYLVRMNQPQAKVAMHLLEPDAPDSLVHWGFFNAIFEQKEYAENYKLEVLALKMLEANPRLKTEFDEKLQADAEFGKSPSARLNFFYQRSPFWDERLNVYPLGRIVAKSELLKLKY